MPKWYLDLLKEGFVLETWYECKGHWHCVASFGDSERIFSAEGSTLKTAVERAVANYRDAQADPMAVE